MRAVFFFLLIVIPLGASARLGEEKFVILFQFTGMKGEQEIIEEKMYPALPVKISYEPRFNLKHHDTSQPVPSARILDIVAERMRAESVGAMKEYAILDIETWKTGLSVDDKTARDSIVKYVNVLQEMRKRLPGYRVGNYGKPVHRDYRATKDNSNVNRYVRWKRRNKMMQPLADALDVFYPSLYAFEPAEEAWSRYAKKHIFESRTLARRGQPVIAFVWPQYHDRSKYKGQFIDYSFWRFQLETLFEYADGVVIWSNHKGPFDSAEGWYRATRDFIESLQQRGVKINPFANAGLFE